MTREEQINKIIKRIHEIDNDMLGMEYAYDNLYSDKGLSEMYQAFGKERRELSAKLGKIMEVTE